VEPGQPTTNRLPDSLGMLRHRWWVVVLGTVFGIAAAGGWLQTRPPVWEATTSVLVRPAGLDTNVVGGRTQGQVNLDTEAQLVRSTAVATGAAERLASAGDPASAAPTPAATPPPATAPDALARRVRVEVPANTSVLAITFSAATPAEAQAGSLAFAEAYLAHRDETTRTELATQRTAIEERLDELDEALTRINEQLAAAPPASPVNADLESQRGTTTGQITDLTDRLNAVATATVSGGAIINEPEQPTRPSLPRPAIVLASGAALGLVAGLGAAGLADRMARRVRRPADLSRRIGVPVIATLDAAGPEEVASPYTRAGRIFDRLRNELTGGTAGNVIVVTSPTVCSATRLTAVNLAASLSRCGHDAVLVAAGHPEEVPLGGFPGAGLSELLAGRAKLTEALQRAPRHPRLRVMTMGATATAAGLLQSPGMRTVLRTLASQTGYVVVEAPPTTVSADAQSLAGLADAALLVVERRRTRLTDAADAAEQLRRVPLLGALLAPPGKRRRSPKYEQPPGAWSGAGAEIRAADAGTVNGRPTTVRPRPAVPPPAVDPDATTLLIPRLDEETAP
jgi:Mrp family chromosome partitioning ATPase